MINLIPLDAQRQVVREYWVRVASVWMFLLGSAFLVVALLNAPVYVLVRSQLGSYLDQYKQASDDTQAFQSAEATITEENNVAQLLSSGGSHMAFSDEINTLQSLTGSDVNIDSYKFTRKNDAIDSITISGSAQSRIALSHFKDTLQNDTRFKDVTLPLSNLAKDKDIPFTITLVPNAHT